MPTVHFQQILQRCFRAVSGPNNNIQTPTTRTEALERSRGAAAAAETASEVRTESCNQNSYIVIVLLTQASNRVRPRAAWPGWVNRPPPRAVRDSELLPRRPLTECRGARHIQLPWLSNGPNRVRTKATDV